MHWVHHGWSHFWFITTDVLFLKFQLFIRFENLKISQFEIFTKIVQMFLISGPQSFWSSICDTIVYLCKYFPRSRAFSPMHADYHVYAWASYHRPGVVASACTFLAFMGARAHQVENIYKDEPYYRLREHDQYCHWVHQNVQTIIVLNIQTYFVIVNTIILLFNLKISQFEMFTKTVLAWLVFSISVNLVHNLWHYYRYESMINTLIECNKIINCIHLNKIDNYSLG